MDLLQRIRQIESYFSLEDTPLNWDHLTSIKLQSKPQWQKAVVNSIVTPNLKYLPGIDVVFEGLQHLSEEPFMIAMNHTDDYNYLPLAWRLFQEEHYPAVWIKGKNYRHPVGKLFFDTMGMIPIPHVQYLFATILKQTTGERLEKEHYRLLRGVFDGKPVAADTFSQGMQYMVKKIDDIRFYHEQLMFRVGALTEEALEKGLYVLVFPEGTRSVQLGEGRTGIVEVAMKTGVPIVPVACNSGHEVYPPHSLPLARGSRGFFQSFLPGSERGRIVYRVGNPLFFEKVDFRLFSRESHETYGSMFKEGTHTLMQKLHELLDPIHQNRRLYV